MEETRIAVPEILRDVSRADSNTHNAPNELSQYEQGMVDMRAQLSRDGRHDSRPSVSEDYHEITDLEYTTLFPPPWNVVPRKSADRKTTEELKFIQCDKGPKFTGIQKDYINWSRRQIVNIHQANLPLQYKIMRLLETIDHRSNNTLGHICTSIEYSKLGYVQLVNSIHKVHGNPEQTHNLMYNQLVQGKRLTLNSLESIRYWINKLRMYQAYLINEGTTAHHSEWPSIVLYTAVTNTMLERKEAIAFSKWCFDRRQRKTHIGSVLQWLLEMELVLAGTSPLQEERKSSSHLAIEYPSHSEVTLYTKGACEVDESVALDDESEYELNLNDLNRAEILFDTDKLEEITEESTQTERLEDTSNQVTLFTKSGKPFSKRFTKTFEPKEEPMCELCSQGKAVTKHLLVRCPKFLGKSEGERVQWLLSTKKCYNCFRTDHLAAKCMSKSRCAICKRKHHKLVHEAADEMKKAFGNKPKSSS
jgi:hypothetical protein